MSNAQNFNCLMVGLPRAGKTTFLAALWHVLRSDEVDGSLRLEKLEGDQEYLNVITGSWLRCEALTRTPGGETKVDLLLRDPQSGRTARLSIPDMSGELYQQLWENRTCQKEFADLVNLVDGCLLFVNPVNIAEAAWIDDANKSYAEWASDDDDNPSDVEGEGDQQSSHEKGSVGWDPRHAPTQVQLIELLQFVMEIRSRKLKVVVVVSAWDRIKDEVHPEVWVEKHLSLLWQFLSANGEKFVASFVGVSAQGGEVSGENSEAVELLEHSIASDRIRVVSAEGNGSDITMPIRWLMSS